MAKRKYKKSNKKKENLTNKIHTLLLIISFFFIIITVNSYKTISEYLPTWQSLYNEIKPYITQNIQVDRVVNGTSKVHYIDVGQGSSILIQSDDKSVLIDAGEAWAGEKVTKYIKDLNIQKLDYVVATHPHSDHIGGLVKVMQNIKTDNIILPEIPKKITPTTRVYEKFLKVISDKNINVIPASVGNKYELGQGIMYVLGPNGVYDNLNDMSVAIKFIYGNINFLSTGDMEKQAEVGLINSGYNLKSDVFALSHHGSKYGNIDSLLNKIDAKYYVAQCGYDNDYGHPHNEVIDRILKRNGIFLRNDLNGDIVFTTNGKDLTVQKQRE